jgi:hypothetical protein
MATRRHRRQEGQATAEMAVAIIALVAALAPLLGGVQVALVAARAQEGARAVAREVARGENPAMVVERAEELFPGATATVSRQGPDAVVTMSIPMNLPFGSSITVSRTAQAAVESS